VGHAANCISRVAWTLAVPARRDSVFLADVQSRENDGTADTRFYEQAEICIRQFLEDALTTATFLGDHRFGEPIQRLSRLQAQMWRAARIVLDVSLHTGAMSVGEAICFLVEKSGLEQDDATAEVKRYTQSPT